MNTQIFIFSGLISLASTLALIAIIFTRSPSTRKEVKRGKLFGIIIFVYVLINVFYFFRLIPPVPLALDQGIVAHDIRMENGNYIVTYETDEWYVFWRDHRLAFNFGPNDRVYIYSSIFAPTDLKKSMIHRWQWYNESTSEWEIVEDIGYDITGGRNDGFRGYTYKSNVKPGIWKVAIITDEELLLGVIDFEIVSSSIESPKRLTVKKF
ncbi:DUF2914 domain-containing protein [Maribacter halichondriae]|uniref:DUF2914 domain-containing protein n=1 Tax=Maribacter halichondriae TaxID=2980554 RepID=UPI003076467C